MIVWLNGTFGAGKTTTARELVSRSQGWRIFDPESVGYMLSDNLRDLEFSDFQDLSSWRRLTPLVLREVHDLTNTTLVAPQAVLSRSYWAELHAGMTESGLDVFHVVLTCDEDTLRRRIDRDHDEPEARNWRLANIEQSNAARAWLHAVADLVIDTTCLTPRDAAESILDKT